MDNFFKNPKRENKKKEIKSYVPEYKKFGITPNEYSQTKTVVIPSNSKDKDNTLYLNKSQNNLPDFFTQNKRNENLMIDPYDTPVEFSTVENNIIKTEDNLDEESISDTDNSNLNLENFNDDECLLFVNNQIFNIGSYSDIQLEVESLIFGSHAKFDEAVSVENIKVYKKTNIKVGVFLE